MRLRIAEHPGGRTVQIDDVVVGIGHHHIRRHLVQRVLDPRVAGCFRVLSGLAAKIDRGLARKPFPVGGLCLAA